MIRYMATTLISLAAPAIGDTQIHDCRIVESCIGLTCTDTSPPFTVTESYADDTADRQGQLQLFGRDVDLELIDHTEAPDGDSSLIRTTYQYAYGIETLTVSLQLIPRIDNVTRASLLWPVANPPRQIYAECKTQTVLQ